MLHRSFKGGKCKTSLKLAIARMKLLKNKREVQVRQMKRDLAHLLETGQEKTAMIRVEHVMREEKTMAAYDFIDIYCELIVARLPIIEAQKNCPIDLKEAVSSIIFASPRCADIPELLDVRKHFTAKYGKDFITSAVELRPDCGVNHTVVENLSARAPDGQTKLKLLNGIAQEHNVQWDPKAFGEKELKPPEDLLNVSRVSGSTGTLVEPLVANLPPHRHQPESSYVKNVAGSSQSSHRTSGGAAEAREFEHPSSQNMNHYTTDRQNWNMDFKDATSAAQAAAESAERASFAARAAAELSSFDMVGRQYSTGSQEPLTQDQQRYRNGRESTRGVSDGMMDSPDMTRRRSKKSTSSGSGISHIKDDIEKTDSYTQKRSSEVEPVDLSWQAKKSEEKNSQSSHIGAESVDNHQQFEKLGHSTVMEEGMRRQSSNFSSFSDDNGDVMFVSKTDIFTQKSSSEVEPVDLSWQEKKSEEKSSQSSHIGAESVDNHQQFEKLGHRSVMEDGMRRQSSNFSSFSDDNGDVMSVSNVQMCGNDGDDNAYNRTPIESMQSGANQPGFNDYPSAIFDESVSDNETIGHDYGLFNPSLGINLENQNTWSSHKHRGGLFEEISSPPRHYNRDSHSPEFPERINKTSSPSQSADLIPVTFDDSDGLNSESEEEKYNSKLSEKRETNNELHQQNSFSINTESNQRATSPEKEVKLVNRRPYLNSSSDDSDSDIAYPKRNQESDVNVSKPWKTNHGLGDSLNVQQSANTKTSNSTIYDKATSYTPVIEEKQEPLQSSEYSSTLDRRTGSKYVASDSPDKEKDSEFSSYLNSESGKELDFGRLRGGFRNKGYTRPPYRKGLSEDSSPILQQTEGSIEKSPISSVIRAKTSTEEFYKEASNRRHHSHVHKELSSRHPKATFESDSDDAEVQQTVASINKSGGGLSRRTRESPALSDVSGISASTSGSRLTVVSNRDVFSPRNVHATETSSSPRVQAQISGNRRSLRTNLSVQQNPDPQLNSRRNEESNVAGSYVSVEHQPSNSTSQSKQPRRDEVLNSQSSTARQVSNPPADSGTAEALKRLSLNKESASRENSFKKAGHVHPKLPDYDSFAAHFQSLRSSQ